MSDVGYRSPVGVAFIQAGEQMGYSNRDYNGEFQTGFMHAQGTVRDDQRCSTNKAFLRPVRNRPNLHVALNSYVTKINIDPETKTATAVRFQKTNGRVYEVEAIREVILSAGVIGSPQILMVTLSFRVIKYSNVNSILTRTTAERSRSG